MSPGGVGENGVLRAPSPPKVVIPPLTPAQLQSAGQKGIDALRVLICRENKNVQFLT